MNWQYYFNSYSEYLEFKNKVVEGIVDNGIINEDNTVSTPSGDRWKLEAYVNATLKNAIANDLINNTLKDFAANKLEFCYSTYRWNSSDLCLPWQNRVYTVGPGYGEFDSIEMALWRNGGGLLHPNCYHSIYPYIPGVTKIENNPLPDSKIKENYKNSQNKQYNTRQYDKWNKRYYDYLNMFPNGDKLNYYKDKVEYWGNRI